MDSKKLTLGFDKLRQDYRYLGNINSIDKEVDKRKRFWCSNIPGSQLIETFCPVCISQIRKYMHKESDYPIWRCKKCSHIYVSPRPSAFVLEEY
jgi:hypothetical protein